MHRILTLGLVAAAWSTAAHATISFRYEGQSHLVPYLAAPQKAAALDYREVSLRIERSDLKTKVFAFGVNCTGGTVCTAGGGQTITQLVRLVQRDDQLLVLPADADVDAPEVAPVTRWQVKDEDADALYVTPNLTGGIGLVLDYNSVEYKGQYQVYDHFYHDFRTRPDGVWFHETFRYQYQKPDLGALFGLPSASQTVVDAADTVAVYLIDPPFDPAFQPKAPLEHFGFFVNAATQDQEMIYDGKAPFNPGGKKILRWRGHRSLDWVVDRTVPADVYPDIEAGLLAWQSELPPDLKITVRKATAADELDSPFLNTVVYNADTDPGSASAVTSFAYSPDTGEMFRASINLHGPKSLTAAAHGTLSTTSAAPTPRLALRYGTLDLARHCDLDAAATGAAPEDPAAVVKGVVTHETGHALGLRHNFEGSLDDADLADYPAGSSVMEYPAHFSQMRIGPYDREAIAWAYRDVQPTVTYPFCSDETAGFLFLLPAADPVCQRYDETTHDPFEHYLPVAQDYVTKELTGSGESNTQGVLAVTFVSAALRDPGSTGYDAGRFDEALALFTRLTAVDATATKPNEAVWGGASYLTGLVAKQVKQGLLSARTLYEHRAPFTAFLAWSAAHAGLDDKAYSSRQDVVKAVAELAGDPYGLALAQELRNALVAHEGDGDEALRLQNAALVDLLDKGAPQS